MVIRLPIIVVGGGLTAVDTATEAAAYYIMQVEKFYSLASSNDVLEFAAEDQEIAQEFLEHGRRVQEERDQAARENRLPNFQKLLAEWGGVTIAYRQSLQDSPAYRLNHEELEKALEEGIRFLPHFIPQEISMDSTQWVMGVKGNLGTLPARTVLIAAGTDPNTALTEEDLGLSLDGLYFKAINQCGEPQTPVRICKPRDTYVLAAHTQYPGKVSFFGDAHPSFQGNVVKAMASAKKGYPFITQALNQSTSSKKEDFTNFFKTMDSLLKAYVVSVQEIASTIVEVIVQAPLAARNFQPGQFFRLQNYEKQTKTLPMEGVALTGASVDKEKGEISLIVLEMGGSSSLCRFLVPGEPVVLMGPTGAPSEIPINETVLLAGGGLGNAVLFSIGQALRAKGNKVLYFAAYKSKDSLFKQDQIEAAADVIVWCCEEGALIPQRPQDSSFHGTIIEALKAYDAGTLGVTSISFKELDRLLTIGSDRMMAAVHYLFQTDLREAVSPSLIKIASINSPMQCMMKAICAQCLQKHVEPGTGKETYVFSCQNQDQPMDFVDFNFLTNRLSQNRLWETLMAQRIKKS